jgi:hypothetical protein
MAGIGPELKTGGHSQVGPRGAERRLRLPAQEARPGRVPHRRRRQQFPEGLTRERDAPEGIGGGQERPQRRPAVRHGEVWEHGRQRPARERALHGEDEAAGAAGAQDHRHRERAAHTSSRRATLDRHDEYNLPFLLR